MRFNPKLVCIGCSTVSFGLTLVENGSLIEIQSRAA